VGGPVLAQIVWVLIAPGLGMVVAPAEIIRVLGDPVLLGERLLPPSAFCSGTGFLAFSHPGIGKKNPSAERALFLVESHDGLLGVF
jgi:hypothetical protein